MDEVTIDVLLPPEHVTLEAPPDDKDGCIEFLVDLIAESGRITDREQVLEDVYAREAQTSTGVGKGIAIPHAQTAGVSDPSLAFARSETGVDFDSADDEPATLLFMILVPEQSEGVHLEILSTVSRALMHDALREELHAAESPGAVRDALQREIEA